MRDIFDQKILCKSCDIEMKKIIINKEGFELRALKCVECGEKIIHPTDISAVNQYRDLKGKEFRVKMRVVGNSHAISIPKEIVNFVNEIHRDMNDDFDDFVKLCFEDFGRMSVDFRDNLKNDEWGGR